MTRVEKMRLQAALQALNGKGPSSKSSHRDSTAAEGVVCAVRRRAGHGSDRHGVKGGVQR